MKVGIFIDTMEAKGGQVRVVANLCHGWIGAGWEVHLITSDDGESGFEIPSQVLCHSLLSRPRRGGVRRLWDNFLLTIRLGRVAHRTSLDAMLAVSAVASVQLALARCPSSMVKLGSEHGYARHYPMPWLLGFCRKFFYPTLDAVVCPASQSAVAMREDCPRTNAINIPNLLVWPTPSQSEPSDRRFPASRRRFVTCGRLVNDKGFDVILEAFGRVAPSCPDWDLVLIGDGPSAHSLMSIVRAKGLAERITFAGFSNQAHLIYEACDVFVYASPQEGFGMVIAEAQASGLPAICFDCLAGPRDIVSDQETGMLIPLGDIESFASAMERLASDEVLRSRLALAAKGVARKLGAAAVIPKWRAAFQRSNPPAKHGAPR